MKKFLTLFVLVCPLLALAQQTRQITGQVLDRADGAPLVGATVFIAPEETQAKDYNPQGTIAYEQGRFAFKLPASVRKVVVSYLGYEPGPSIFRARAISRSTSRRRTTRWTPWW